MQSYHLRMHLSPMLQMKFPSYGEVSFHFHPPHHTPTVFGFGHISQLGPHYSVGSISRHCDASTLLDRQCTHTYTRCIYVLSFCFTLDVSDVYYALG